MNFRIRYKIIGNKITIIFILIYSLFNVNLFARNEGAKTGGKNETLKSNKNLYLNELIKRNGISLATFCPIYYYKGVNVSREDIKRILRESEDPDVIRRLNRFEMKQNPFKIIGLTALLGSTALFFIGRLNRNETLQISSAVSGFIIVESTALYAWYCQIREFDDIVNRYNSFILQKALNNSVIDKHVGISLSYHFK